MHILLQPAMSSTGAGNDFQKDKQFRKLNVEKDIVEVTIVRGGSNKLIPNTGVVVADVLVLTTGDKVTAGTIASPLVVRVKHECVMLSQAAAAACTTACEAPVRDHALHHRAVLTKCSC